MERLEKANVRRSYEMKRKKIKTQQQNHADWGRKVQQTNKETNKQKNRKTYLMLKKAFRLFHVSQFVSQVFFFCCVWTF